jgi:hypothetical protein
MSTRTQSQQGNLNAPTMAFARLPSFKRLKSPTSRSSLQQQQEQQQQEDDSSWYKPYHGPYEIPRQAVVPLRTAQRDSWGRFVDSSLVGAGPSSSTTAIVGGVVGGPPLVRVLSPPAAAGVPQQHRARAHTATSVYDAPGIGDTPVPRQRAQIQPAPVPAATLGTRSSLASLFSTFGQSGKKVFGSSAGGAGGGGGGGIGSGGARKVSSLASLRLGGGQQLSPRPSTSTFGTPIPSASSHGSPLRAAQHATSPPQTAQSTAAVEDGYLSPQHSPHSPYQQPPPPPSSGHGYYSNQSSNGHTTPSPQSQAQFAAPPALSMSNTHPYATAASVPLSAPPVPVAPAPWSDAASPKTTTGPSYARGGDGAAAVSSPPLHALHASRSTPNLHPRALSASPRPPPAAPPPPIPPATTMKRSNKREKSKERWLSAETWYDAVLLPRPRFKVIGSRVPGEAWSPPTPLQPSMSDTKGKGIAKAKSYGSLHGAATAADPTSGGLPVPPPDDPGPSSATAAAIVIHEPEDSFDADARLPTSEFGRLQVKDKKGKRYSWDDMSIPSSAPSLMTCVYHILIFFKKKLLIGVVSTVSSPTQPGSTQTGNSGKRRRLTPSPTLVRAPSPVHGQSRSPGLARTPQTQRTELWTSSLRARSWDLSVCRRRCTFTSLRLFLSCPTMATPEARLHTTGARNRMARMHFRGAVTAARGASPTSSAPPRSLRAAPLRFAALAPSLVRLQALRSRLSLHEQGLAGRCPSTTINRRRRCSRRRVWVQRALH